MTQKFIIISMALYSLTSNPCLAETHYSRIYAIGAAFAYTEKQVDPETTLGQKLPEVFGYRYFVVNPDWSFRPGIRLSYAWTNPSENIPRAFQIIETDFKTAAEVAILWNHLPVFPSITLGAGMLYRKTDFISTSPILSNLSEKITEKSLLPFLQGQVSLIFSQNRGKYELAPFARYTYIFADSRYHWSVGAEVSLAYL